MKVTLVGIDLAKSVFQIHCADEIGRPVVRRKLRRNQVIGLFSKLQPCLVGMEACAGAHHWARELLALPRSRRAMVTPSTKSGERWRARLLQIPKLASALRPTKRVSSRLVLQKMVLSITASSDQTTDHAVFNGRWNDIGNWNPRLG